MIVYGDLNDIAELDRRRAGRVGDKEHRQAVQEQEELLHRREREKDPSTPGAE